MYNKIVKALHGKAPIKLPPVAGKTPRAEQSGLQDQNKETNKAADPTREKNPSLRCKASKSSSKASNNSRKASNNSSKANNNSSKASNNRATRTTLASK